MERINKVWGEKWCLFQNDLCEVSLLYLKPWHRCSWHRHQQKYNQFFVVEGTVCIKTEYGIVRVEKGQIFTTSPGEMHEFRTIEHKTILIEIMYVQYDPEDIQRDVIGGEYGKTEENS